MRMLSITCLATLLTACSGNVRETAPATDRNAIGGAIGVVAVPDVAHPQGETAAWWYRSGAARAAANGAMRGQAKNVIVFLGDGMSLTTVAAARILDGQRKGQPGEENQLSWETFPATAFSKTYNTDSQTPDSAGTMSAIATGVKTFMGSISVGPASRNDDCAGSLRNQDLTWLELAQSAGMATGIVSTARLTHATPAATYAHVPTRGWENDSDLPAEAVRAGCRDIARQFIETPFGGPVVALGGGLGEFVPATIADPEDPSRHGLRADGRNLVAEWHAAHPQGAFVRNTQQLRAAADAPRLFGLFSGSHMDFDHDRDTSPQGEPDLAEMTRAAIHTLSRDPDGYVLLVEGARIDMANHYGNAFRALDETIAMSRAVQAAIDATSAEDTLILVTADHSHSLNFVGYPVRGNPILGKVRGKSSFDGAPGKLAKDGTGLPYTTLTYANGPGYTGASDSQPAGSKHFPHPGKGYKPANGRPDLTDVDTTDPDYMQEATVPLSGESHGGEDVGIWARGPGSDAVRGTVEQNVIYHFIVQATPKLRERLCAAGTCNAAGVPVELPAIDDFVPDSR
jgi:alkaline phosphatase